ncbi:MAG: ABC transporter substrate-binding protein [Firmicutes bacterium]|nr:ABC transporter substrate-binding protein [Bacillota bacterium]
MAKKQMRLVGVVASVALLSTALAGCSTQPTATAPVNHTVAQQGAQPTYGGTLTMDLSSPFPHLDPALAYDTTSYEAVTQMYDQLLTYKGTSNTIIPDLASRWSISKNGKVYSFWMKNAKFWNGDPVTADSFITEFQRVLSFSASGGQGFIAPLIVGSEAFEKGQAKTISGMKSLDGGKELQITLTQPSPTFQYVLAMPFFSAVDPKYIAAHPDTAKNDYMAQHPMGTGAFELSSVNPGQQWVFTKNPHYFKKGLPYLSKLVFNLDSSPESVLLHFEQGQTQFIGYNQAGNGIPGPDYLPIMSSKWKSDTYTTTQVSTNYIGLNSSVAPTNNLLVRKAMEYAVNKEELLRIVNGRGVIANQPIPISMPSGYQTHLPASATYNYNPTMAKKLLKEAGYHGQAVTIYSDNSNPTDALTAQALQGMFKQVGISAKVKLTSWNVFLANNETGKQGVFTLAWLEDFPDPSDFLNTLLNSNQRPVNNSSMFNDKAVDKLLNKAQTMPNGPARNAIYKQVESLVMEQAPWIPYVYPTFTAVFQPNVHGYYLNPNLVDPFQAMWISK